MARVAAIDCGTNTLRLLIADVDAGAQAPIAQVTREMRTVRLGEGLERTGRFAPAALQRAAAALEEYAALIARHHVDEVRMVATSATRDAADAHSLIEIVRTTVGVEPEVISGREEGELTFRGVRSGLAVDGPCLVADIGGGSTELVTGDAAGVGAAISMDIGVVRLTERHVRSDPPAPDELARVAADAASAVADGLSGLGELSRGPLVGVAGTATTAAALAAGLDDYDSARIHGSRTSYADLMRVRDRVCALDTEARTALPAMHPGRASVFPAGMVILDVLMRAVGANELLVSESDILDGIALSIVR